MVTTASGWTDERISILSELWDSGKTANEIAEILGGVSRNAVIGKAHRLGLSSRPSPIKQKEVVAEAVTVQATQATAVVDTADEDDSEAEDDSRSAKIPAGGATILQLTERMCKWPHGDPQKKGFHFCGKASVPGMPYCAEHAAMAYQSQTKKKTPMDLSKYKEAATA